MNKRKIHIRIIIICCLKFWVIFFNKRILVCLIARFGCLAWTLSILVGCNLLRVFVSVHFFQPFDCWVKVSIVWGTKCNPRLNEILFIFIKLWAQFNAYKLFNTQIIYIGKSEKKEKYMCNKQILKFSNSKKCLQIFCQIIKMFIYLNQKLNNDNKCRCWEKYNSEGKMWQRRLWSSKITRVVPNVVTNCMIRLTFVQDIVVFNVAAQDLKLFQ